MIESKTSRRVRRTRGEVRELMLGATRDLCATKGFAATTREIAARATVTERLLFNHFESKEELFAAAVVRPFEEFVETQLDAWQLAFETYADQPQLMTREYVAGLYALVLKHEAFFRALSLDPFGARLQPVLGRLEALTAGMAAEHGYLYDPRIAVRIVFGAVTTMALNQASLLETHTIEDIIDELSQTLASGLTRRPGDVLERRVDREVNG